MKLESLTTGRLFYLIENGNYLYGEETKAAKEIFKRINRSYFFVKSTKEKLQGVLVEKVREQVEKAYIPNLYFISSAIEIIAEIGNEKTLANLDSIIIPQKNLPERFDASKLTERLYSYMNEMNRGAYIQEHMQKSKEKIRSRVISSL